MERLENKQQVKKAMIKWQKLLILTGTEMHQKELSMQFFTTSE